ncbi:phosphatase and actin regulator 3 isoform 3-T3 [Rhynchonycteris naso]
MAASEDGSGCLVSRGRSQSDPSVLTDSSATSSADAREYPDEMDSTPPVRSEYLVSGIRTPPVRRNSKLATLGRIFKPWKWRKKKNEKLKQTTSALEKKMAGRQGREELIKKGLLEMVEQAKISSASRGEETDAAGSLPPTTDESSQALAGTDSLDSPPRTLERSVGQLPSTPSLPTPLPKTGSKTTKNVTGQPVLFQDSGGKNTDSLLRGQLSTPTGSPHPTTVHRPLPPSRVIEELHRALATKHRQDSFQGRDSKGSPKKRVDVRLSRTSSVERGKEREEAWNFDGAPEGRRTATKESEENKENLLTNSELEDDLLLYQDEEALNDSIISGTLPRKCKKELLAVRLRNRPSKQELEDRNIFPRRTDEERQEIRQQIEMKLSKRLSQRPAVEELERRNILKQRNDLTEQEERREIKQRLTRKLNQRPTVDELRDRKILIRFSDYVEVAKAQDYDRRADKPWTRLSAADKAAIRKELNEYKSNEMEVHASSKHLTRFHRP